MSFCWRKGDGMFFDQNLNGFNTNADNIRIRTANCVSMEKKLIRPVIENESEHTDAAHIVTNGRVM
jgi:hypothetical protein